MFCKFTPHQTPGRFLCDVCKIPSSRNKTYGPEGPPQRYCNGSRENVPPPEPPPDLTPHLSRLAEETNHPEILDQTAVYARAVIHWADGFVELTEPFEARSDEDRAFCVELCRANVCRLYSDGVCQARCCRGMDVEVKSYMASETCPAKYARW